MSCKGFTGNGTCSSPGTKIVEPYMSIAAQDIVSDKCRHSGYIRKEGDRIKTWYNRYTVLHKGCIYYYANAEDSCAKGQFSLNGYSLSAAPEKTKYKWTFKLVNIQPEKRTYYFAAHSEREMIKWMDKIKKEIDDINGISENTEEDLPEYHYPEVPFLFPKGKPSNRQQSLHESVGSSHDPPEYCPPPDSSSFCPLKERPKIPSPPRSRRPASVAGVPIATPLQRSQSEQSVSRPTKPLPVPRRKNSLELREVDWYDNEEDESFQNVRDKNIKASSRNGNKLSVGSLGLEERQLHPSPLPSQAFRLIEPVHPAPTKAERLVGSTAISQKTWYGPAVNKDQGKKLPKPGLSAKPQISQPLPFPPKPAAASPPFIPQKPVVSPKPSNPISLVQKTLTDPQRFLQKDIVRGVKERTSKTLPSPNKMKDSDPYEGDDEYLKVVVSPDDSNLSNKKSTLERGRPEGMSAKNQFSQERSVLPPTAERLDLDKTTVLPLFECRKDGFYLIHSSRSSETKKALSVWTVDRVRHFLIFQHMVEGYALDPAGPRFNSIPTMLHYYYRNYLPRCVTRLTEPCMKR